MKRFMYLSVSILALTLAFAIGRMTAEGPTPATAGWVDHSACGIVASSCAHLLDENGQVWTVDNTGWMRDPVHDPPIPAGEIKQWTTWGNIFIAISQDNIAWLHWAPDGQWHNVGPWPGGPSPAEKTTWSKLKSEFK
jgi:hypothetical protein